MKINNCTGFHHTPANAHINNAQNVVRWQTLLSPSWWWAGELVAAAVRDRCHEVNDSGNPVFTHREKVVVDRWRHRIVVTVIIVLSSLWLLLLLSLRVPGSRNVRTRSTRTTCARLSGQRWRSSGGPQSSHLTRRPWCVSGSCHPRPLWGIETRCTCRMQKSREETATG